MIEAHSRKELEEYIAFRPSVVPADGQPELHERQKTVCMKLFHKLADKTDLNVQELQTYYRIRLCYVEPFDLSNPKHEVSFSNKFLTVFIGRARITRIQLVEGWQNNTIDDQKQSGRPDEGDKAIICDFVEVSRLQARGVASVWLSKKRYVD